MSAQRSEPVQLEAPPRVHRRVQPACDPVLAARSRIASSIRLNLGPEAEAAARADLAAAHVERRRARAADVAERALRRALTGAPPLTPEQRARIALILNGAG